MGIGLVLLIASLLAISFVLGLSPWFVSGGLLLTYIGFTLIQTALINSVSQTLQTQETGTGMGLFNLVTFISAAVGTALVARVLAGGWLNLPLNPVLTDARAFGYSNLMIAFRDRHRRGGRDLLRAVQEGAERPGARAPLRRETAH